MACSSFSDLAQHIGHKIAVVSYGTENVACECETCNEVLFDFDDE